MKESKMDEVTLDKMYKPLGTDVVCKSNKITHTASGLIVPDSAVEQDRYMEVVAVGSQITDLKVGDLVLTLAATRPSFPVNGIEYFQMKYYDILGVVEPQYQSYFKNKVPAIMQS